MNWRVAAALFLVAVALRLALLPMATLDTGDTAARIWLGWLWGDDPTLITHGLWGPLHFYLIGTVMQVWGDPVWAPLALHVLIGSLIPVIAYRLTLELFGSQRSAVVAGSIFAVYPAAIAVSLGARAETPFLLFLGLGLIFLARAWRPGGRMTDAVLAGLAVTVGSAIRYEAWLLLPFLGVLLIGKPKLMFVFVGMAMMHPVFWMVGNWLAYGNPLHSLLATSTWLQDMMGIQRDPSTLASIGRVWRFIEKTAVELTVPVSLLVAVGAMRTIQKRRVEAVWLIPPLGLFLIFAVAAFKGTMSMKSGYTTTFGMLLIPFVAASLDWLGIERWNRVRVAAAVTVLLAAIGVFMLGPLMNSVPFGTRLHAHAVPSLPDEKYVRDLQALIDRADLRRSGDALISDFFGLLTTPYVAWQTKLHPHQICRAPSIAAESLDPAHLEAFLRANPSGVLITAAASELRSQLALDSDESGTLAGVPLRLEPVGSVLWDSQLRGRNFGVLTVSRYEAQVARGETGATPPCSHSCPISHCGNDPEPE